MIPLIKETPWGPCDVVSTLGEGGCSKTFALLQGKTLPLIMKQYRNQPNGDECLQTAQHEFFILKKCHHPLVVFPYGHFQIDQINSFLFEEHVIGHSLLQTISSGTVLQIPFCRKIFFQLVKIVEYLHFTAHVFHRDIKMENIIINKFENAHLIDFDLAIPMTGQNYQEGAGTLEYMSPEILLGKEYNESAEIWSLGVVLYTMVTGNYPFSARTTGSFQKSVIYSDICFPLNLSDDLVDLLSRMLMKNPHERITIEGILNHPWLNRDENGEIPFFRLLEYSNCFEKSVQDLTRFEFQENFLSAKDIAQIIGERTAFGEKLLEIQMKYDKMTSVTPRFMVSHANSVLMIRGHNPALPKIKTDKIFKKRATFGRDISSVLHRFE